MKKYPSRKRYRRRNYRRLVLPVIGLLIVLLAVLLISHKGCASNTAHDEDAEEDLILWSDTLSNSMSDVPALKPMDTRIESFMARNGIKGLSLAMMRHDSLLYAKGYGWADVEAKEKMTPLSMMRIASASKLITAIAIMKLVEDGRLHLDSKVFGPGGILNDSIYTNNLGDPRMTEITVDHLLQHSGGFGRGGGDPMFSMSDIIKRHKLSGPPSSEKLASLVLKRRLAFQPGKGRRYSNFGYLLLSLIIEKVSGENYYDYVNDAILRPAKAVNFRSGTNYYADRHYGEVKYYGPDTTPVEEFNGSGRMVERVYGGNDINGLKGAGGWVTTASDLLRVVASIDGFDEVPDMLSRSSIDSMAVDCGKDNLTRGWAELEVDGSRVRTGTLSSSHAYIRLFPDGNCWVIITNSGNWRGAHFSRDLSRLVSDLNATFSSKMPRKNLW